MRGKMKALIFDMDGTLLNSEPAWSSLNEELLKENGISREDTDYDMFITEDLSSIIKTLEEEFGIHIDEEKARERALERMEEWYSNSAVLRSGVDKVLKDLEHHDLKLVVGTATRENFAVKGLRTAGILDRFEWVYSSSTDGYPKNDKKFFEAILKRLDLEPHEVALFDDALYAILTANECGIYTVGVEDPSYHQDLAQIERRANCLIHGFDGFDIGSWLADFNKTE